MRSAIWALVAGLFVAGCSLPAFAQSADAPTLTASPPGAKSYFVDLKEGATIAPTTTIHFGLTGMGVAPAGVAKPNSGHFHLLIDADPPALDQPIPNNENHLHFGAGQTEATVTLAPGKHTLQILLGDANHVPHSPPVMSSILHVTVAEPTAVATPAAAAATATPTAGRHPSPANAKAYIESPTNGAYVTTTFTVRFGLTGMGVAPAGFDKPNSGHHHLIVDAGLIVLGVEGGHSTTINLGERAIPAAHQFLGWRRFVIAGKSLRHLRLRVVLRRQLLRPVLSRVHV